MSDDLAVLREALARHQKTKHPRWAQLADWASARLEQAQPRPALGGSAKRADVEQWFAVEKEGDLLDVPRLFRAFHGGVRSPTAAERVKLLAHRKDPRIVAGLLALLEAPPFRAGTALPFFRACIDALVASGDVRARLGLESLATRYKAIVDSSIGEVIAEHCGRGAKKMPAVEAAPLSPADEQRLAELERHFEVEKRAGDAKASETKRAKQSDDDLLSAIYASPDDDGPRLVFADTLSERGDDRSEFITLQVLRATGKGTSETLAREQALLQDTKRAMKWSLPLSNGGTCVPRRGLPFEVQLSSRTAKSTTGLPAWATVEAVLLPNGLSGKALRALVDHPVMGRVRRVMGLHAENRALLGDAPRAWTSASMSFNHQEPFGVEVAQQYPRLRELHLMTAGPLTGKALAGFVNLERLSLSVSEQLKGDLGWLSAMPRLTRLALRGTGHSLYQADLPKLLPRGLTHLTLGTTPRPEHVAGLAIDTLEISWLSGAKELLEVSKVLGPVRELHVGNALDPKLLDAGLPTWTEREVGRLHCGKYVSLERVGSRWGAHADFSLLEFERLVALAAVPGIDALTVSPLHVNPLHRPNAMPDAEALAKLRGAWGDRLELLPSNPRVLAASLDYPSLR